jgi:hypothetical protein
MKKIKKLYGSDQAGFDVLKSLVDFTKHYNTRLIIIHAILQIT